LETMPWVSLEDQEKDYILKVLKATHYNRIQAAQILKMPRTTLWRKIRKYRLDEDGQLGEPEC